MNEDELTEMINNGFTIADISKKCNKSNTAVRYWIKKYNLKTVFMNKKQQKFKYSDQELYEIYVKSSSLNQFLLNLGVNRSGGAFYHFKKRLEKLNLNKFTLGDDFRSLGGKVTAEIKNKESVKRKVRLPRICLKKSMDLAKIEYKCMRDGCGLSKWFEKPITLHIHHKDEDKTNNHISNLEYLCPNCHSEFHYSESKRKYNKCRCGVNISKKSKLCMKCFQNKIRPRKFEVLEEELRKLICEDKISFVEIGKKFGVSDNAIRKRCKKLGIPYRKKFK